MSTLDNLRRITPDNISNSEIRQAVSQIAEPINFHLEQIINTVNGNLDYDNIRSKLVQVDVTVGANGVPLAKTQFRTVAGVVGTAVISAKNQNNSAIFPTGAPFITIQATSSEIYEIKHVTGLQAGQKYRLIFEVKVA